MWQRIIDESDMDKTNLEFKDMRYFIYYPPTNAIRLIDVNDSVLVEDILKLVKQEFGLNFQDSGPSETSIVLSYNGSDLKPKWSLADLGIPSGSIIRCLYREEKAADLYIHCGYNKQVLKLFDTSITIETSISKIRKIISNKLGLPLSVFCLETFNNKQRLYDQMKLMNYDLKIHDRIYLKVWTGYEKFINSCIKGFTEPFSPDDLTRHYQSQVALYIAAFYGHMELANSVMQQGARSDRPVGEHPSRQWSSDLSTETFPEMLKCPIHIAIERKHVKMVDLFVRQSILCTQIRDPITGYLPYLLALDCSLSAQTKEDKQLYYVIYFYLHDKQFNLKIPLNSTGEYVSNLLTSTISANAVHRSSSNLVYISLPFYCKIIQWYERARENAWKKYGGHFYSTSQTKRIYPKQGLLGYKVLIDGYNNTFEVPTEQLHSLRSAGTLKSDPNSVRYVGFSEEERDKLVKMKSFVKDFALDERKRAKQIAAMNLQQSRRPPPAVIPEQNKPISAASEVISSPSEISTNTNFKRSVTTIVPDTKTFKSMLDIENSSITDLAPSTTLVSAPAGGKQHRGKSSNQQKFKHIEEEKYRLPSIKSPVSYTPVTHSSLTNRLDRVVNANRRNSQTLMSSTDAYTLSSSRIAFENDQKKATKRRELLSEIQQSVEDQLQHEPEDSKSPLSMSFPSDHKSVNTGAYIPLPDHPTMRRSSPIKSRLDVDIRQATVTPYERYASATTRSTAVHCLQEATFFKGKSWLKQVEISKEMVKHHVKRRIRRADDDETSHKPILLPLRTNVVPSTNKSNTVKIN